MLSLFIAIQAARQGNSLLNFMRKETIYSNTLKLR